MYRVKVSKTKRVAYEIKLKSICNLPNTKPTCSFHGPSIYKKPHIARTFSCFCSLVCVFFLSCCVQLQVGTVYIISDIIGFLMINSGHQYAHSPKKNIPLAASIKKKPLNFVRFNILMQ